MENHRPSLKRLLGFSLMVAGLFILYLAIPIAASSGLFASWLLSWFIVSIIGVGAFLLGGLDMKHSLRSLLIAFAILIPWSGIFFISLPGDYQLLLAALVAFFGVLFYRYYQKQKSTTQEPQPTTMNIAVQNRSLPKKAAGYTLMIACALLFFFIIPEALTYGLLITSLVIVAIAAVGVVGYSLISPYSFKQFIGWLISALIVVLLPFAFILPTELQILTGSLLIVAIILLFHWGYKKITKNKKEQP